MSNDRSRDRRDAVFDREEKKSDANLRAKRANFFLWNLFVICGLMPICVQNQQFYGSSNSING